MNLKKKKIVFLKNLYQTVVYVNKYKRVVYVNKYKRVQFKNMCWENASYLRRSCGMTQVGCLEI